MTLDEYLKIEYDIVITPDTGTDGTLCYRAEHPQLSGCMSHGLTPEEAMSNLIEAKELYIKTLLEEKLDVPLPVVASTGATYSSFYSITTVLSPIEDTENRQADLPLVFDVPKEIALNS